MVELLWKTVWQLLKMLNTELLYDPTILLLLIHTKELKMRNETNICMLVFIAGLFAMAKMMKTTQVSMNR